MLCAATSGKYGCVYMIAIEDHLKNLECEIILIDITGARMWENVIQ